VPGRRHIEIQILKRLSLLLFFTLIFANNREFIILFYGNNLMETNIVESKSTSSDWLTQLQDLIEIIDTDEKLAIYSDAQHKEGLTSIFNIAFIASSLLLLLFLS